MRTSALLRPLLQDRLLPTAAYVGGPAEIAYHAQIGPAYAAFDAERRFGLAYRPVPDHKQCECGAILRGVAKNSPP